MSDEEILPLPLEIHEDSLIKVMGVGGGGGNAVNYLYKQGLADVTFLVCNTDKQALGRTSVPTKLQLGPGLGAGGKPEVAAGYAEDDKERIREALNDGTKMLFIAAGMGGGTGTGASPIIAEVAQEMGILTVGIVTIPFAFEKGRKIRKAMEGVARLAKHVDALLIINNEKLPEIYPTFNFLRAFEFSNDVVANATRAIAEIITLPGIINTDFADVYNTLRNGGIAIMNVGRASGEERITQAIRNALNSPLVNTNDVHGAKRLLLNFYCSTEHAIEMSEVAQINAFVDEVGEDVEVQWGVALDETLGEDVRITIIATGYGISGLPILDEEQLEEEGEHTTKPQGKTIDEAIEENYPTAPKEQEKASAAAQEPAPTAHRENPSADTADIVIDFDDDKPLQAQPAPHASNTSAAAHSGNTSAAAHSGSSTTAPKEEPKSSGLAGWLRRH